MSRVTVVPAPRRRLPRGTIVGIWALTVALVVLLIITFLPTSYVIQRPGPVYNTLGTATAADGEQVPLISVEGAETFETGGTLDLTTVQVVGNRERTPSWFELATAWIDSSKAVVPLDVGVPRGRSPPSERNEQNATLMVDSQQEATAAALTELGYDVGVDGARRRADRRIAGRGRPRARRRHHRRSTARRSTSAEHAARDASRTAGARRSSSPCCATARSETVSVTPESGRSTARTRG